MRGRSYLAQFSLLLLVSAPTLVYASASIPTPSEKSLYHDVEQNIYYNQQAVCDFIAKYLEVKSHISHSEWQDIQDHKYANKFVVATNADDRFFMYVYEHNGIRIEYSTHYVLKVWKALFAASRLSGQMHNLKYYADTFQLGKYKADTGILRLECNYATVAIKHQQNAVKSVEVEMMIDAL